MDKQKKLKIARIVIQAIIIALLIAAAIIAIIKLYPIFIKIQNDA